MALLWGEEVRGAARPSTEARGPGAWCGAGSSGTWASARTATPALYAGPTSVDLLLICGLSPLEAIPAPVASSTPQKRLTVPSCNLFDLLFWMDLMKWWVQVTSVCARVMKMRGMPPRPAQQVAWRQMCTCICPNRASCRSCAGEKPRRDCLLGHDDIVKIILQNMGVGSDRQMASPPADVRTQRL